eukprot:m.166609 g.166609  ORF g.166609 m.166609 type:complete len:71 (-) comp21109_c1_seq6:847-1059(-)
MLSVAVLHFGDGSARATLAALVTSTGKLLQPLIAGMQLSNYHHFAPPCNSDYPMPSCPFCAPLEIGIVKK